MTTVRRAGTVSAVTLSALSLALGLAHAVAPRWAQQFGLDVWNLPALRDQSREADEEGAELQAKQDRVFRQIAAGQYTASRLAEGKLTLAEATDELEVVFQTQPEFGDVYQAAYHVPTFRQGVARYVIGHVMRLLERDPDRWATVSARLEAEFASLK